MKKPTHKKQTQKETIENLKIRIDNEPNFIVRRSEAEDYAKKLIQESNKKKPTNETPTAKLITDFIEQLGHNLDAQDKALKEIKKFKQDHPQLFKGNKE